MLARFEVHVGRHARAVEMAKRVSTHREQDYRVAQLDSSVGGSNEDEWLLYPALDIDIKQ
jgi:hypothetical protein